MAFRDSEQHGQKMSVSVLLQKTRSSKPQEVIRPVEALYTESSKIVHSRKYPDGVQDKMSVLSVLSVLTSATDSDAGADSGSDAVWLIADRLDAQTEQWVETATLCPDVTHSPRLRKIHGTQRWVCLHWVTPKAVNR